MKTICYGELLIDMIADGREELSRAQSFRRYAGGAAANVAAQIRKLGGDSAFLGKLGDDPFGKFLLEDMARYGIETTGVVLDPVRRTTVAFVGLDGAGVPDYLFYRAGGASATIRPEDIDRAYLEGADAVYTSSIMLTDPRVRETTRWVLGLSRERGIRTAFDLNLRPTAWESREEARETVREVFTLVDILKINDGELSFLLGREADPAKAGAELMGWYPDMEVLIVTCGEKGAYLFTQSGGAVFTPSHPVDAVDTTGAGDSYMGAFLYAYGACGGSLERLADIGRWSAAAAELTVQSPGAVGAMPDRAAMERCCARWKIGTF